MRRKREGVSVLQRPGRNTHNRRPREDISDDHCSRSYNGPLADIDALPYGGAGTDVSTDADLNRAGQTCPCGYMCIIAEHTIVFTNGGAVHHNIFSHLRPGTTTAH